MARGLQLKPLPLTRSNTATKSRLSPFQLHPHCNSYTMSSTHKATKPHEKHPQFGHLPLSTSGPQDCALSGSALLNTPYFNKGVAHTREEREQFKLTGLLPQNIQTLDQQVKRAYQQYSTRQDDLAKNTFMTSLAEQNQVLYFKVSCLLIATNSSYITFFFRQVFPVSIFSSMPFMIIDSTCT
jgi:hypothetical protein